MIKNKQFIKILHKKSYGVLDDMCNTSKNELPTNFDELPDIRSDRSICLDTKQISYLR